MYWRRLRQQLTCDLKRTIRWREKSTCGLFTTMINRSVTSILPDGVRGQISKIHWYILQLHFLGQMYAQDSRFWKENTKQVFPFLRCVHWIKGRPAACLKMTAHSTANANILSLLSSEGWLPSKLVIIY